MPTPLQIITKIRWFLWITMTVIVAGEAFPQEKYNVKNWIGHSDAPNSLYHNMANQAYKQLSERDSTITEIHSLKGWKERQKKVKKTLNEIVGPFPDKTPLNPKITKKVEKDDYTIENILLESQPGFYVTSSLFIPKNTKKNAPTIIYVSGHTDEGYRSPTYQRVILNLVKKGFVVLAYDPIGQGERIQYTDKSNRDSLVNGRPTLEHSYPGAQAFITGSSQARYEIWDAIRAIDYLLTRKEVDSSRIGVTGRSGGGTQSAYIGAFDDRIYAAAPENYITTFQRLLQSIGPQDAEQNFSHEIVSGIDHPDLLEVRAPKPTLMITTSRDMFSIQGGIEAEDETSSIFKAYGKPDHFYRVESDTVHASSKPNRESMYAFFQNYLDNPGDSTDLDVGTLPKEDLQVTKTGNVFSSFDDAKTVFDLNKKEAEEKNKKLRDKRKNPDKHLPQVLESAKKLAGYHKPKEYHKPVFTGRYQKKGYDIEKYFVQSEGDYVIPYLLLIPDKTNGKAVITLNPKGKSQELKNGKAKWFLDKGFTVLTPDLSNVGELAGGNYKGDSSVGDISYGKWFLSTLIGRSIVGIQAGEATRLVHILKERKDIEHVYGMAQGTLGSTLIHAAAFDKNIEKTLLIQPLISYSSVVMNRYYDPRFIHSTVVDALTAYDLPDLEANLAPRELTIVNPVNGKNEPVEEKELKNNIKAVKKAYKAQNAKDNLNIISNEKNEDHSPIFKNWVNK